MRRPGRELAFISSSEKSSAWRPEQGRVLFFAVNLEAFGGYLLIDRLSTGGMAEVYLAKASLTEPSASLVAIKRILPTVAEDPDFRTMFLDEASISGELQHHNIGTVLELGIVNEEYFLAMEYISGQDLRDICNHLLEERTSMPAAMALRICSDVCRALAYAHGKCSQNGDPLQIIHRDVSPPNVLVSYSGQVKLIDFGIARAASRLTRTQAGKLKGKFAYMSPEQVTGKRVDQRSDIFSCGILLFEMLTLKRPFKGNNQLDVLKAIRKGRAPKPSSIASHVTENMDQIVMRALEPELSSRYADAAEMLAALEEELTALGGYSDEALADWMLSHFPDEFKRETHRLQTIRTLTGADIDAQAKIVPMQVGSVQDKITATPFITSGSVDTDAADHTTTKNLNALPESSHDTDTDHDINLDTQRTRAPEHLASPNVPRAASRSATNLDDQRLVDNEDETDPDCPTPAVTRAIEPGAAPISLIADKIARLKPVSELSSPTEMPRAMPIVDGPLPEPTLAGEGAIGVPLAKRKDISQSGNQIPTPPPDQDDVLTSAPEIEWSPEPTTLPEYPASEPIAPQPESSEKRSPQKTNTNTSTRQRVVLMTGVTFIAAVGVLVALALFGNCR